MASKPLVQTHVVYTLADGAQQTITFRSEHLFEIELMARRVKEAIAEIEAHRTFTMGAHNAQGR